MLKNKGIISLVFFFGPSEMTVKIVKHLMYSQLLYVKNNNNRSGSNAVNEH